MSVNSHKYRYAEQGGEQAHDRTWNGYWHIKPAETFEPLSFHRCFDQPLQDLFRHHGLTS